MRVNTDRAFVTLAIAENEAQIAEMTRRLPTMRAEVAEVAREMIATLEAESAKFRGHYGIGKVRPVRRGA